MSDLTDNFHPASAKCYKYYLDALDADYVYEALIGYGMLGNKVPPALTTKNFLSYCKNNQIPHPKKIGVDGFPFVICAIQVLIDISAYLIHSHTKSFHTA